MGEHAAAFVEWLRLRGAYVSPKLDLFKEMPSGDRTVCAKEAVAEGEQLLMVPLEATLRMPTQEEWKG